MTLSGKVYLQYYNNIPVTKNIYDLQMGFEARGFEIIPVNIDLKKFTNFKVENSSLSEFKKEDILCSGFPLYRKVAEYVGLPQPCFESYPEILKKFLDRSISETTLGQLYRDLTEEFKPFFVKPKNEVKLFTGIVAKERMDLLKIPTTIPDSTELYVSEIVDFVSEHRVYVNQHNVYVENGILDCKSYNGNPLIFPDPEKVEEIVKIYNLSGGPKCYGIDFGVVRKGNKLKTILVEVNGALQLGSYGLNPYIYSQMVEDAWIDMLKKSHI
jgi:hypothetical protein